MTDSYKIQKNQFEEISKIYDDVYHDIISATHRVSQEIYYGRCKGKRVLDIGNGGQPPESVMGGEIAGTLKSFVGIDHSLAMMRKTKDAFSKVVGDAVNLPFKDDSFDYVLVNGLLHHLGYQSREDNRRRVQRFVREALRVCARELIIYELFTPPLLENMERVAARVLGYMPTFVLSERSLDDYLREMGLARNEIAARSLSQLTRPLYPVPILMDQPWLKVPAFLSPFNTVYFVIPKRAG